MRKKLNRTSVIILIVAALTVAVPSLIVYSYYDRARKGEQLFTAIFDGNTDKALALLKSGADPNYNEPFNGGRITVIDVACYRRNAVIIRYLLSHGVKPWESRQDMAYLIRRTLAYNDNASPQTIIEIMQTLVEHGADVNAVAPNKDSPLILAIDSQQNDAVKFLIGHGADVNRPTGRKASPLRRATRLGNTIVVRMLLKAGADPSKCGTTFDELINLAQEFDHNETAAILKDAMAKRKAAGSGGLKK